MDSYSITPISAHKRNLKERASKLVVVRNLLVVVVSLGMIEGRKDFENELNKRPCHEGRASERAEAPEGTKEVTTAFCVRRKRRRSRRRG